jgi:hypothetical protein
LNDSADKSYKTGPEYGFTATTPVNNKTSKWGADSASTVGDSSIERFGDRIESEIRGVFWHDIQGSHQRRIIS